MCICHCGNKFLAVKKQLRNGRTHHCGCDKKVSVFGDLSKSPLLDVWKSMLDRCFNKNNPSYEDYGGRGITVCEQWRFDKVEGFRNFIEDMGERPEGLTLDRIDFNGNYEPSNCRWADRAIQSFNRRKQKNSQTVRVGIRYDAENDKWRASINYEGKAYHLYYGKSLEIAIKRREEAELKYYGKIIETNCYLPIDKLTIRVYN